MGILNAAGKRIVEFSGIMSNPTYAKVQEGAKLARASAMAENGDVYKRQVGEGVRTCGVPREELFVASKVAAELKTYDEAKKSIDEMCIRDSLIGHLPRVIAHLASPRSLCFFCVLCCIKNSGTSLKPTLSV